MTREIKFIAVFAIAVLALITESCQTDIMDYGVKGRGTNLVFGASLAEDKSVYTRAEGDKSENGLDSIYVAYDPWDTNFYIQLNTTDENGREVSDYGTYIVESGFEGRLRSKNLDEALDWLSNDKEHEFYSWTVPWMTDDPADGSDYYSPSDATIPVNFYNSSEMDGFELNHNNAILEKFIGAKSKAYSYAEHGKYVELTYHHLVSKIKVDYLILVESSGAVQEDLQADMTFMGLPVQATFYPHPTATDGSGAPANSRPYVGPPYVESEDIGVTYYIQNSPGVEDVFYICPEIDFSTIDYQIKINSKRFQFYDTYYGTFDDVVFERSPGYGYDQGEDESGNMRDDKILHAGEEMHITVTLIPGVGPGLKVVIRNWSTSDAMQSEYHSHAGFYNDAEIKEFLDLLFGFTYDDYYNSTPELDLIFEMYGYIGEDGKKYIRLYDNVTLPPYGNNNPSNIFPIPDGFVIDGMGHQVFMKSNNGIAATQYVKYFNVGPVRDIYLTDGVDSIYIDPDGFVWTFNKETGEYVNSGNQLPELTGNQRSYDININGYIRPSDYFNGNPGLSG